MPQTMRAGRRPVFTELCACVVLGMTLGASEVSSEELSFGPDPTAAGWTTVNFPGIAPAVFKAAGRSRLEVSTHAAAGLLCRAVSKSLWRARKAHWRWRVHEGAPATDLTRRGADDRALGVYLVFGSADDAGKSPMALLGSSSVTALVYVFGSDKPRDRILPSPHMQGRGKFIVLRSADAAKSTWLQEEVDIAHDYMRAFGQRPSLLLAVVIMSDSDDTRTRNRAEIEALSIE
jgi:hypothetical protein